VPLCLSSYNIYSKKPVNLDLFCKRPSYLSLWAGFYLQKEYLVSF